MEQYFKRFRWKPFRKKKKVRFDSIPIVHIIPRLTEEEKAVESEERWQEMLNYMHDRSMINVYKWHFNVPNYKYVLSDIINVCAGRPFVKR